jgi:peroxiredoxin
LHRAAEQFNTAGLQILLVGQGTPAQAEQFRKALSITLPIICDPDKDLFREYGLGRGTLSGMASPSLLLKGLKTLTRGYTPGLPRGDVMQLPGVFLVDSGGDIRYSHYAKDPSDNPAVETLLGLKNLVKRNNK